MSNVAKLRAAVEHCRMITSTGNWTLQQAEIDAIATLRKAVEATLPKTKTVERWAVTYWSLTAKATVCRIADDSEQADRIVAMNGETAAKHLMRVEEWLEPPE